MLVAGLLGVLGPASGAGLAATPAPDPVAAPGSAPSPPAAPTSEPRRHRPGVAMDAMPPDGPTAVVPAPVEPPPPKPPNVDPDDDFRYVLLGVGLLVAMLAWRVPGRRDDRPASPGAAARAARAARAAGTGADRAPANPRR